MECLRCLVPLMMLLIIYVYISYKVGLLAARRPWSIHSSICQYCRGLNIHGWQPRCKHNQAQIAIIISGSFMIIFSTQASEITCMCLCKHMHMFTGFPPTGSSYV